MIDQEITVRMAGMAPGRGFMNVGDIYNINHIDHEMGMVWCYTRAELFGNHPGSIQMMSTNHIKIFLNGMFNKEGELGDGTIHELKRSPKLTGCGFYCFSFLSNVSEFHSAAEARRQFLIELGIKASQHRVMDVVFPLGTAIEENANLTNILQYKKPKCPTCGKNVYKVYRGSDSYLNQEQFDACKAGDFCCDKCPSNGRGKDDLCYWWNKELNRGPFAECFKDE